MSKNKQKIDPTKSVDKDKERNLKTLFHDGKTSPNISEFMDFQRHELQTTYGNAAQALLTGKLPFMVDPERPETVGLGEHEAKHRWDLHTQRVSEVEKTNKNLLDQSCKVFSALYQKLSPMSRERVSLATINYAAGTRATARRGLPRPPSPVRGSVLTRGAAASAGAVNVGTEDHHAVASASVEVTANDWEEVLATLDLERLVQRVWATHRGVVITHSKTETIFNTLSQLENLKIKGGETLPEFRRRFEQQLKTIEAVGGASVVPPPEMQVQRFLKGLEHVPKYREYKSLRSNGFASSTPFPDTLGKVCEELAAYNPFSSASGSKPTTPETAYVVKEKKKREKQRPAKTPSHGAATAASDKSGDEIICHKCGQAGHYASGCAKGHQKRAGDGGDGKILPKKNEEKAHVVTELVVPQGGLDPMPAQDLTDIVPDWAFHTDVKLPGDRAENEVETHEEAPDGERAFRMVLAQYPRGKGDGPTAVLLDCGATCSVFRNSTLVSNIRRAENFVSIGGIDNRAPALYLDQIGDFHGFTVYLSNQVSTNVLSFSKLRQSCRIVSDDISDSFSVVMPNNRKLVFSNAGGLYVFYANRESVRVVFTNWSSHKDASGREAVSTEYTEQISVTVAENAKNFTRRQVLAAQHAYRLIESLAYPSEQSVIDMLNNG